MPKRWVRAKGYGVGECIEVTPSGKPIYKFRYYTGVVLPNDIEAESDNRREVLVDPRKMKGEKQWKKLL